MPPFIPPDLAHGDDVLVPRSDTQCVVMYTSYVSNQLFEVAWRKLETTLEGRNVNVVKIDGAGDLALRCSQLCSSVLCTDPAAPATARATNMLNASERSRASAGQQAHPYRAMGHLGQAGVPSSLCRWRVPGRHGRNPGVRVHIAYVSPPPSCCSALSRSHALQELIETGQFDGIFGKYLKD